VKENIAAAAVGRYESIPGNVIKLFNYARLHAHPSRSTICFPENNLSYAAESKVAGSQGHANELTQVPPCQLA
jgi:hypothetical protein